MTPNRVFADWVRHDHGESRLSDRELVRAFADENVSTFNFLIEIARERHNDEHELREGGSRAPDEPRGLRCSHRGGGGRAFQPESRAKSSDRVPLGGAGIEVRGGASTVLGSGVLGDTPWPGVEALYYRDRAQGP